ncbi:MAG: phage major capsid protein [Candidatus Humimicrobiaceae bacterium]
MKNVIELMRDRNKVVTDIREVLDLAENEKRELTAEDNEKIKNLEKQFDTLSSDIEAEKRQQARESLMIARESDPVGGRIESRSAEPDKEIRATFNKFLAFGDSSEYRALQKDTAVQAGYLVAPQQFSTEMIKDVDNIFYIRNLARKFTLAKAESLGFPKRTARMARAVRGSEIGAPNADSTLAFGKREFMPKYLTAEILVSKPLLRNAAVDPEQIVREELAYAFAVTEETEFMTGSGANEAMGVFTAHADGISTARDVSTGNLATSITFDGLLSAKFALKQQYWPKARWIFHRDGVLQLAKLKNGDGQYIWQSSVQAAQPDMLLGFPCAMSEYAPNTFTTGLYVGILGDFSYYWIVDCLNIEIQALFELYARTNQVDFIARAENDGMPVLEEAFSRVKLA